VQETDQLALVALLVQIEQIYPNGYDECLLGFVDMEAGLEYPDSKPG
jgi:hypothetical protein